MLLTNAYNFSRIFKLKSGLNLSSTPRIVSFMMKFQTGQFSRKHSGNILVSQHLHRLQAVCQKKYPVTLSLSIQSVFLEYYRAYPLELSSMHSVFFTYQITRARYYQDCNCHEYDANFVHHTPSNEFKHMKPGPRLMS